MKKTNKHQMKICFRQFLNSTLEFIVRERLALILRVKIYIDKLDIYNYRLEKYLENSKKEEGSRRIKESLALKE